MCNAQKESAALKCKYMRHAESACMKSRTIRSFGKIGDGIEVGNLTEVQRMSYRRFLQDDKLPEKRDNAGFEALLRSIKPEYPYRVFPIKTSQT